MPTKQLAERRREFLIVSAVLILLLLRAWQLRMPGLLETPNEDEFHHNYWLINNQSVYGIFTIWGLKALLEHILRIYFWFPMLSLGWPAFIALSSISLGFVVLLIWGQRGFAEEKSHGEQRLIQLFGLVFSISTLVCMLWLLALPRSSSQFLGISRSRLALIVFLLGSLALGVRMTILWIRNRASTSKWVNRLKDPRFAWLITGFTIACFFIASVLVVPPLYGIQLLPSSLMPFYLRLLPMIVLAGFIAFTALFTVLLIQPQSLTRSALLVIFLLAFGLILALAIKPFGANRNYTELMLLVPSFAYSLVSVSLCFILSYYVFRARALSKGLAAGFALLIALWLVYHPGDIAMASFARMYVFASLLSLIWFSYYVFMAKTDSVLFFLISFLFANSHFFAVPIVLAAYAWEVWNAIHRREMRAGLGFALQGLAILASVLLINLPIIPYLFDLAKNTQSFDLPRFISESASIAWGYLNYLGASIRWTSTWMGQFSWLSSSAVFIRKLAPILILIYLFAQIMRRKQLPERKILYFGLLILPLSFIFFGTRAEGGIVRSSFNPRYYTPFLGFGFALGILMVLQLHRAYSYFAFSVTRMWKRVLSTTAWLGALLTVLIAVDLLIGLVQDWDQLTLPPANWSMYYLGYSEIKDAGKPLLLLNTAPISIQQDIPLFYLEYTEGGFNKYYEIYGSVLDVSYAKQWIDHFVKKFPDGIIVLDWLLADCPRATPEVGGWEANVERVHSGNACIWKIENASGFGEVCQIAQAFKFPAPWAQTSCFH